MGKYGKDYFYLQAKHVQFTEKNVFNYNYNLKVATVETYFSSRHVHIQSH